MVNLTIDGIAVSVADGSTLLTAAQSAGVSIPTLCYLREVNEIGACRICVVEVEGHDNLVAACNTKAEEGMVVYTNTPRVKENRRINLQLILSQHDSNCPTCVRNGNCTLQTLARENNLTGNPFTKSVPANRWPQNSPLMRDESKCIKCMRCIQVCDKIQGMHVWDVVGTGSRTTVGVSGGRTFDQSDCTLCGQCITHCPVGALTARDDTMTVLEKLADPKVTTVVQVAPAVRAAWAENLGLSDELASTGRMVTALKRLGFDYVFDTNFAADLTIMEEGSEFLERFTHKENYAWPMFTSCCPGWVRFIKGQYPQFVNNLSSAKSPQQMFGAVARSYFAEKIGVDAANLFVVSVMPCTAKKSECELPNQKDDVDAVLTTRELERMLRAETANLADLPETAFDSPLGSGTGAAVIFGTTGGVMDAALRSAYFLATRQNPDADAFTAVRGQKGWKEATFAVPGVGEIRVAVASGLENTRKLMKAIDNGDVAYDFVEIMACPGGCAGGGGQPIHDGCELAESRGDALWSIDKNATLRFSHENPDVQALYAEYLDKPLSHKAHELLHTDHNGWEMP